MSPAPKWPHDAAPAPPAGAQNVTERVTVRGMIERERRGRGVAFRGDLMREARLARGWSQREAADAIGVGLRGYQVWERDKRDARTEANNFAKISQVFGLPREKLMLNADPVAVLSEVERLELIETQLAAIAVEVRRARKQLRDQDAALTDRLEALGSAVARLNADVAGLASREGSAPASSRSDTTG